MEITSNGLLMGSDDRYGTLRYITVHMHYNEESTVPYICKL